MNIEILKTLKEIINEIEEYTKHKTRIEIGKTDTNEILELAINEDNYYYLNNNENYYINNIDFKELKDINITYYNLDLIKDIKEFLKQVKQEKEEAQKEEKQILKEIKEFKKFLC